LRQHRPGEPAGAQGARRKSRDGGRQRGQRARRCLRGTAHGGGFLLGNGGGKFGDQVGLGGEIAVDGAGSDSGAFGDGRNQHRAHAAFIGGGPSRRQNGLAPFGQPAGNTVGAAIGHDSRD